MRSATGLLIFIVLTYTTCCGQADSLPATHQKDSIELSRQMDVCDVLELIFKKNLRAGKKEKHKNGPFFTILPSPGYAIATGFTACVDGDLSFYTNKKYEGKLSYFGYNAQYSQYNQVLTQAISDLLFVHDKLLFTGDWRFLNFPTYTYGLGSLTTAAMADRIDYNYFRFYETALYRVGPNTMVGPGYNLDYHWHIKDYNENNGETTAFKKYGYTASSIASGPTLNLKYDSRNNIQDPVKGTYLNLQCCFHAKVFGSNGNWTSLLVECYQFVKMPTKQRKSCLAFRACAWLTPSGTPPYLDIPYTAGDTYNTMGRGYAEGRFRGLNLLYLEAEYRFAVMKNELVGGVIFANLQSFSEWPGNNFAAVQPGIGAGLRVKLNKFTHTNWSVDYGFGTGGSRGFFLGPNEAF